MLAMLIDKIERMQPTPRWFATVFAVFLIVSAVFTMLWLPLFLFGIVSMELLIIGFGSAIGTGIIQATQRAIMNP